MPTPEIPLVQERQQEFEIPKNLQSEIKAIETNPKTNIQVDNQGQPVITPQNNQSVKIQLPSDKKALWQIAKKSISDALTWLARQTIRLMDIKKIKESNANSNK